MLPPRIVRLLLVLLLPLRVAPQHIEALPGIPQLSYEQVALIAGNATARCKLMPQLCGWQLHLYEGHAFRLHLPGNEAVPVEPSTTTSAPRVKETETKALLFALPGIINTQQLLIYAQVEKRTKSRKRKRGQ